MLPELLTLTAQTHTQFTCITLALPIMARPSLRLNTSYSEPSSCESSASPVQAFCWHCYVQNSLRTSSQSSLNSTKRGSSLFFCSTKLNVGSRPEVAQVSNRQADGQPHLRCHHNKSHIPAEQSDDEEESATSLIGLSFGTKRTASL